MNIEQEFGLELKNPSTREEFHMGGGGTAHTDKVFIWSNVLQEWVGCVKITSKGYFKNEGQRVEISTQHLYQNHHGIKAAPVLGVPYYEVVNGIKKWAMEQITRKPKTRFFKYTGEQVLTRGDHGVNVIGGHNTQADPEAIFVFDPDCGEQCWISIVAGLECGDWVEITQEQHTAL